MYKMHAYTHRHITCTYMDKCIYKSRNFESHRREAKRELIVVFARARARLYRGEFNSRLIFPFTESLSRRI